MLLSLIPLSTRSRRFACAAAAGAVIAIGFVLRTYAGAVAISVPVSDWLLVCTVLLALFLGLSKRRHEITLLASGAHSSTGAPEVQVSVRS